MDLKHLHGQRVSVHMNLHKGCFSIKQAGLVVAHADEVFLTNASFRVQQAGWRRALAEGQRNVHALVYGTLVEALDQECGRRVRYHPFETNGSFVYADTGAPVAAAPEAHLTARKIFVPA